MIITGDPYALDGLAVGMGTLAEELAQAAGELSAIETETWRGPAADAFKAVMHQQPGRYVTASEAFFAAAGAIAAYAAALEDAQAVLVRAELLAESGQAGQAGQEAADQQLATAMRANAMEDLAAAQAIAVLRAAEQAAPQRPGLFGRLVGDCWHDVVGSSVNVVIGFGKGTVAMAEGLYQAGSLYEAQSDPLFGWFDPGAQARADAELEALGSDATEHPVAFAETIGKNMVDWDEWSQNPDQALGEIFPNILLGIATDGAGPAAEAGTEVGEAVQSVSKVAEVASQTSAERQLAKEILRSPTVTDAKLQKVVEDLYKGVKYPNRVGTGTTADAVRNELETGKPTGGTFHLDKATQYARALSKRLKMDLNYYDRLVAQSLLDDLKDALGGHR
jgi:hypothetical protein